MEKDGFQVPEKIKQMITAGHTAFYKTENGKRFAYDFTTEKYIEIITNKNIVSLNALKGADKVVKSCASASLIDLDDGVYYLKFTPR